jgi:Na+/H+ antiporter NhaD/arsenite permease-like protein
MRIGTALGTDNAMQGLIDALHSPRTQAVLVFLIGYVYICTARRFRAAALWIGVLILLLLGIYAPVAEPPGLVRDLWHLARNINWNVLMILSGAMLVAELFIQSKVPVVLADFIVKHMRTVGGAALGVCALSSFLSAFIDNVTTVLIVAPVALVLAKRMKTSPVPFIIGLAISSNLQGTATLIGDPPSLILANGLDLNFLDFFFYQGKPGIFWAVQVGAVGSMIVLWMMFFRKYKAPASEPEAVKPTSWFPTVLLLVMVVALSVVSQIKNIPNGEKYANGTVCVVAALIGITWHRRRANGGSLKLLGAVDFETVALLAAIFSLTFALESTGFIAQVADWIAGMVGTNTFLTFTIIVWMSVALSAVIDNIPYTAVMLPTVLGIATKMTGSAECGPTHILFAFGLLIGACLGGNISPVGAAANIVGVGLLRKEGHDVSFRQFAKMGLPFTIAATVPAYLFIWWLWG